MNLSTQLAIATAATAASISLGVYASTENDALHPPAAVVGLTQAIQAAEQHTSGQAIRAEYEAGGSPRVWTYDVEVVVGAKVFDVRVDAAKGTVISSKEDVADHDDDDDREDEADRKD